MKKLPIGYSDFKTIITEGFTYVDKSLFIKDVIQDSAQVLLLPRPRRFGKTLNLSMLKYFFEVPNEKPGTVNLFQGLAIEQDEVFQTHCGKYPVIFLTFKDVKEHSFEASLRKIKVVIAKSRTDEQPTGCRRITDTIISGQVVSGLIAATPATAAAAEYPNDSNHAKYKKSNKYHMIKCIQEAPVLIHHFIVPLFLKFLCLMRYN